MALFVRGPRDLIFDLSDKLGFESEMDALAISVFEDGADSMHIQALYNSFAEANQALKSLNLPVTTESFITPLPDEDWVAKSQAGLPPVYAGRFCVYGSHSSEDIPANVTHPILIDAGAAFGTGHHGTTKGCLQILDGLLGQNLDVSSVLDLGCGAGTLAIAAAMSLNLPILATDIDVDAVDVTRENAAINDVSHLIKAVKADGFDHPVLVGQTFNLIFANILAGPLMGLAPDIAQHLSAGGHVILSGILDEQADKVAETFTAQAIDIKKGPSLAGWTSLLGRKRTN